MRSRGFFLDETKLRCAMYSAFDRLEGGRADAHRRYGGEKLNPRSRRSLRVRIARKRWNHKAQNEKQRCKKCYAWAVGTDHRCKDGSKKQSIAVVDARPHISWNSGKAEQPLKHDIDRCNDNEHRDEHGQRAERHADDTTH